MIANSSKDQAKKERLRRKAILSSGNTFIKLQLLDESKARMRISAIDDIASTQTQGGWKFKVVQRQLAFEMDPNTLEYYAYVLYTEDNMMFLASHDSVGYWEIVDVIQRRGKGNTRHTVQSIIDEIENRSEQQEEDYLAKVESDKKKYPKPVPDNASIDNMNIKDLEEIIARRKKIEMEKVTPTPQPPKKERFSVVSEESSGIEPVKEPEEVSEEKNEEIEPEKDLGKLEKETVKNKPKKNKRKAKVDDSELDKFPSTIIKKGVGVASPEPLKM